MNTKFTSLALALVAVTSVTLTPAEAKNNNQLLNQIAVNTYLAQTAAAQAAAAQAAQAQAIAAQTAANPYVAYDPYSTYTPYAAYNTYGTACAPAAINHDRDRRDHDLRRDFRRDEHKDRDNQRGWFGRR